MAEPKKELTKAPLGPSGKTVAQNVKRLMEAQNLTFAALVAKLAEMDRPIPLLGLRKIVAGLRRVDVDDLVALAVAFGVSPVTLLTPYTYDDEELVTVTGVKDEIACADLWKWLRADGPLPGAEVSGTRQLLFIASATPVWRARQYAEGVLAIMEIDRLEDELKAGGEKAEAARKRMAEIRAEYGPKN